MKDKTRCYCYFAVKGDFNPAELSKLLNIQPSNSWVIGDLRKNGKTHYDFALWETGRTEIVFPEWEMQCVHAIKELIGKEEVLNRFKELHDVSFALEIVPEIYNGEKPVITFGREVIKFCYLTDTDIDIDQYIYPFSEE